MSGRVTILSHSSTSATNAAGFPDDEPLDTRGAGWAAEARGRVHRPTRVRSSPAPAARQTAAALGLVDQVEPLLRDWDLGRWRGRTLDEVAAAEPDGVSAWLSAPAAAPHGGEPLVDLLARTAGWLAALPGDGHTVAITHPAVVRAVVLAVLGAPPAGFWRIDIAPLTATVLRGGPCRWTLRSTGRHLASRPGDDPD
ncbi:MAG: histidine phosphatase family protein [Pseudonocardia sp.]|nr:histidine phosphatase family protein [Pseudonocardia sp.]